MMNEDLHEALPLWSLDRRGDGPRGTATTRGVVGVSSPLFVRPVPLGDPLGMVRYAPSRRAPERATTDHIAPLAMIRRILAAMRLPCGRVRSRQQLKELDNHLLTDIGLGREAVDYTSPRPELHWHWD
jgi:uncharacterized protein YjiS (DUF1127 family)